jgi:hypothetical protein
MLQTRNRTPFAVGLVPTLDVENRQLLTVVVKATFAFEHGQSPLSVAREQKPICSAPVYHGDPGRSSLRYEADSCPAKPHTDIVMVACARSARETAELDVSLRAGPLRKVIRAFGDRPHQLRFARCRSSTSARSEGVETTWSLATRSVWA